MLCKQPESLDREAIELNRAAEDAKPMTFVDYAELIWRKLAADGVTQQKAADELGWQLSKLKMYAGLKSVCSEAWVVIKVATSDGVATESDEDEATNKVATATFTERLLRDILDLDPGQQLSLCADLAKGEKAGGISKGRFKTLAAAYRARNEMRAVAVEKLVGGVGTSSQIDRLIFCLLTFSIPAMLCFRMQRLVNHFTTGVLNALRQSAVFQRLPALLRMLRSAGIWNCGELQ